MKSIIFSLLICCLCLSAQGPYVPNKKITSVPTYAFYPGQQLTYRGQRRLQTGPSRIEEEIETLIWVIGQNADQSWHMAVRRKITLAEIDSTGARIEKTPQVDWARWNMQSNGDADYNRTMADLDPNFLFIRLPDHILEASTGWSLTRKNYWEKNYYTLDTVSADTLWIVKDVFSDPLVEVGRISLTAEWHIDWKIGLPVRREESFTQMNSAETRTTTVLERVDTLPPAQAAALTADARLYFANDSLYDELLDQALRQPKKTRQLINQARSLLIKARDRVLTREFQVQLDAELSAFGNDSAYIAAEAERQAMFIEHRARPWQTTDFEEKPYALKDFRKKIVIMDFWYRGCPWCIMAMPQLRQLAEYFQGQPIVVLGMNVDKNDTDAKFVMEKMKLNYLNLRAAAIARDYGIKGYPQLLILDHKGVIWERQVGYAPDLFDKIRRTVEELLDRMR